MAAEEHGRLLAVSQVTMGDELAVAGSTSDTTLTLTDVSDFDEDGGSCRITGAIYAYSSPDFDADTIVISPGLTGSTPVGARVDIWDNNTSRPTVAYSGLVQVDGQTDGDAIEADIDHSLVPMLGQSIGLEGRSVTLVPDGGGYRVGAVHGKEASQDALTYLPGGFTTLPDGVGSASGFVIEPDAAGGVLKMYTGSGSETSPASINPIISVTTPMLRIRSPEDGSGNQAVLTLGPFGSTFAPGASTGLEISGAGGLNVDGAITGNTTIEANGDITALAGMLVSGNLVVQSTGALFNNDATTSTNAVNLVSTGANRYVDHTSLSAHKLAQRDLDLKTALRQIAGLRPRTWADRYEVEGNDEFHSPRPIKDVHRTGGFIVEETDADLLTDHGPNPDVDSQHIIASLVRVVQDLTERVAKLETH